MHTEKEENRRGGGRREGRAEEEEYEKKGEIEGKREGKTPTERKVNGERKEWTKKRTENPKGIHKYIRRTEEKTTKRRVKS